MSLREHAARAVVEADDLIARLGAKPTGRGDAWRARCPCPGHAHADQRPSLDIRRTPEGRMLVICRSLGHRYPEVLAALGIAPTRRRSTTRPVLSHVAEARREIIRIARRQPWARPGVLLRYALADWLRAADHLRRLVAKRDDPVAREALAIVADVERIAESMLATLDDEDRERRSA